MKDKFILIAYKPNSSDYCMGCHMASYGSDFIFEEYQDVESLAQKLADIDEWYLEDGEDGFEPPYIIYNGETIIKLGCFQFYEPEDMSDWPKYEIALKVYDEKKGLYDSIMKRKAEIIEERKLLREENAKKKKEQDEKDEIAKKEQNKIKKEKKEREKLKKLAEKYPEELK